jgi:hypothetical protein
MTQFERTNALPLAVRIDVQYGDRRVDFRCRMSVRVSCAWGKTGRGLKSAMRREKERMKESQLTV